MVIGLEVHVELSTKSKIFCGCKTEFGKAPNTQVCPVCLGLPGTLPVLNKKVVEYAIKAGLATNCQITRVGKQDRKNYFYPDLPKAYQISQYDQPLCYEGHIVIEKQGEAKKIGITRIHIEEDAGKLIHHPEEGTLIDYNRGGVPLIEIVSEPDIRSAEEAKMYLQKLRGILLYTGISDCKMNEGSFRCDVNLSIRKPGEAFGTRTEMKNLNSFQSIVKAIDHEYSRQLKLIKAGGQVSQETRKWDQDKNQSYSMRTKEDAHDYRYFPDPDLQPILIDDQYIKDIEQALPELPDVKKDKYLGYGLSSLEADLIAIDLELSGYYDKIVGFGADPKIASSLLISELSKLQNKYQTERIAIDAEAFSELVKLIEDQVLNNTLAKKVLLHLWDSPLTVEAIIEKEDLRLIKEADRLLPIIEKVLVENEKSVKDYLKGKDRALQSLIGQVMRYTEGKAEPEITRTYLLNAIKK